MTSFKISKQQGGVPFIQPGNVPTRHIHLNKQKETKYVNENCTIDSSYGMYIFDAVCNPTEVFLKDGADGDYITMTLSQLDCLSVVVNTSRGSFVLAYPIVSRQLIYYNKRWNIIGDTKDVYSFYPSSLKYKLCSGSTKCIISGDGNTKLVVNQDSIISVYYNGSGVHNLFTANREFKYANVCIMNSWATVIGLSIRSSDGTTGFLIFEKSKTNETREMKYRLDEDCVDACISSDGKTIALSKHGCISVYKYNEQSSNWDALTQLNEDSDKCFGTKVSMSGNGLYVFTISDSNTFVSYNIGENDNTKHIHNIAGISKCAMIMSDYSGKTIVTTSSSGRVWITSLKDCLERSRQAYNNISVDKNISSISLTGCGNTLIIGMCEVSTVLIYSHTFNGWDPRTKLTGEQNSYLGYSCSISSSGDIAVVSAIGPDGGAWILS